MKNIEKVIFNTEYTYNPKLINRCIEIVQKSEVSDSIRITSYKLFIFKMMNKIIRKNIYNYQNLMKNFETPIEIDNLELVSECYIIMNTCVYGFILKKDANFYFYYNVALSRKFFRWYQRQIQHQKVELTDTIAVTSLEMRTEGKVDMMDFLLNSLNFNDTEKRIINSKLAGQRAVDFLENNPDINSNLYANCIKRIKAVLIKNKQEGGI